MLTPLLLTLASVILYTLSFPPFSLSACAWVALAPFFIAISGASLTVAVLCGVFLAVGVAFGVAWWLPSMIADYLQISPWIGWAGFFAVSIGLAGVYCAMFAVWLSWLTHKQAVTPLLVAAGWGVFEFARANLLIGNPWVLAAYSQIAHPRLLQIADITGPYGIGMLIVAVNVCLAGLFSPRLRCRRPAVSSALVGAALIAILAYGQWRLSQTFADGEPIQVAVVQPAIDRQFRWSRDHWRANLDQYLTLTRTATNAKLIFWPEHAVAFFLQKNSRYRDTVLGITQETTADLILGGQHYDYGERDVFFHNSVFLVQQGQLTGRYDKQILVPFAEENPLKQLLPNMPSKYQAGRRALPLPATAARIGAFVCFESMYPDLVRKIVARGAEVLANPSNDDWFGYATPAWHQLDIASLRAIENRRYLVRATATGYSAVIDPHGRSVALSGFGSPDVLTATIFPSHTRTLYQRWGDAFCWSALVWVFGVSLFRFDWWKRARLFQRRNTV